MIRFGVYLGRLHFALWPEATRLADELGYESVWIPEHLVAHPEFLVTSRQNPTRFPVANMCLLRVPRHGVHPGV